MKSSQWYIIGSFLILISFLFIIEDMVWTNYCNVFDDDSSPLSKVDIVMCLNREIFDPFILLLLPLGVVFDICGWIESRSERRK